MRVPVEGAVRRPGPRCPQPGPRGGARHGPPPCRRRAAAAAAHRLRAGQRPALPRRRLRRPRRRSLRVARGQQRDHGPGAGGEGRRTRRHPQQLAARQPPRGHDRPGDPPFPGSRGVSVDLAPTGQQSGTGLLDIWPANQGSVLLPQADIADPRLRRGPGGPRCAFVQAVTAYHTVDYPADPGRASPRASRPRRHGDLVAAGSVRPGRTRRRRPCSPRPRRKPKSAPAGCTPSSPPPPAPPAASTRTSPRWAPAVSSPSDARRRPRRPPSDSASPPSPKSPPPPAWSPPSSGPWTTSRPHRHPPAAEPSAKDTI